MQTSIPDLSQISSVIGASMMRFQTISSFLKCCETTTWPLFFIASAEMDKGPARYMDISSDDLDLAKTINEYAIEYLGQDRITNILNEWLTDSLISTDKKPLLECVIRHQGRILCVNFYPYVSR